MRAGIIMWGALVVMASACGDVTDGGELTPDAGQHSGQDAAAGDPADASVVHHTVSVTREGLGQGDVTSEPAGIDCGADCTAQVAHGSTITLSAVAGAWSVFAGWSGGGCDGTGTCALTVTADVSVTAAFALAEHSIVVVKDGNGNGTVVSDPTGIACGDDCEAEFTAGSTVTLTATPDADSEFDGWEGGGCSGTGACAVTVDDAKTVTATFTLETFPLVVETTGDGEGTVTSSPAGIVCGQACSADFDTGTSVTLFAAPSVGSTFGGWTGAGCTGAGNCVVAMDQVREVSARFDAVPPNVVFVTATSHTGDLGGLAGADAICQQRAQAVNLSGTFRAWLSTENVDAIDRLSGARGWVRVDGVPVVDSLEDLAAGRLLNPIRIDERGGDVGNVFVVTSTRGNGTRHSSYNTCDDWTSTSTAGFSGHGLSHAGAGMFTIFGGTGCSVARRLYCFEVSRVAVVEPTAESGRYAFITQSQWAPGGGIQSADSLCATEAANSGLPGTYLALLATNGASAASRFNAGLGPWRRMDGVRVTATGAAMFSSAFFDSFLNLTSNGTSYQGNTGLWSGAATLSTAGTSSTTCENWTSNSANATGSAGRAGATDADMFFGHSTDLAQACSATHRRIACLQE
jgi:hypothetical protein